MKRREFITFLGGAVVAWPLAASAQQPAMPTIGFLHSTSPEANLHLMAAFRRGLSESGFVEGRNVAIEYRWAQGQYDKLPALAEDLVGRSVTVIATAGGVPPALAAKAATSTIPIIFVMGSDPVEFGLVASLNRPGGNATGVSLLAYLLDAKRIEVLRELISKASIVGLLVNPTSPQADGQLKELQAAANATGAKVIALNASAESDFQPAFASLVQQQASALLVSADPFFLSRRDQLVALAAQHAVPTVYHWREFADAGGLMSYGTSTADAYRQAGIYVSQILKGAKPAELPVQQAVKVELVINLKTAKTLGLSFPLSLLARADEVIE